MIVLWLPAAKRDRRDIWDYVAANDIEAAVRLDELFDVAVDQLAVFPNSAPRGAISGTREMVPHPNYRLVYQVEEEVIRVLAIIHVARLWPPNSNE
jgi:toxin ParE1/3/4